MTLANCLPTEEPFVACAMAMVDVQRYKHNCKLSIKSYYFILALQFWSPYFQFLKFWSPYFKNKFFGSPISTCSDFLSPGPILCWILMTCERLDMCDVDKLNTRGIIIYLNLNIILTELLKNRLICSFYNTPS
jgi:hypothetical protein